MRHKPDSVPLRGAIICLCGQNPEFKRRGQRLIPYLALLREGLALPAQSLETAAGSYPAFSPLPDWSGGLFSAALSFSWNMVHDILVLWRTPCPAESGLSSLLSQSDRRRHLWTVNIHPFSRYVQSRKEKIVRNGSREHPSSFPHFPVRIPQQFLQIFDIQRLPPFSIRKRKTDSFRIPEKTLKKNNFFIKKDWFLSFYC